MTNEATYDSRLDEGLERLHVYGPEHPNGNTNHGPMAIEALASMGRPEEIIPFIRLYETTLERDENTGRALDADGRRAALGDPRRHHDWLATFRRELAEEPARDVLRRSLPNLLHGSLAAALHGPIMVAHAWRALELESTPTRIEELARGLAYWSANVCPLPGTPTHSRTGEPLARLLERVPRAPGPPPGGAIDAAIVKACNKIESAFGAAVSHPRLLEPDPIAVLMRAGAAALASHPGKSIIFVHAITGPSSFRILSRELAMDDRERAIDHLWQACAGLFATYGVPHGSFEPHPVQTAELIDAAIASRDAHAIKAVGAALYEEENEAAVACRAAAAIACRELALA